jgi:predicted membrane protein
MRIIEVLAGTLFGLIIGAFALTMMFIMASLLLLLGAICFVFLGIIVVIGAIVIGIEVMHGNDLRSTMQKVIDEQRNAKS